MSLRLVKRPRSPNWIMRGSIRGMRLEESTGTADRSRAEEIRAKREAEFHTEFIYGKKATVTFAHAVQSYLENGGSRRFLAPILNYFKIIPWPASARMSLISGQRSSFQTHYQPPAIGNSILLSRRCCTTPR